LLDTSSSTGSLPPAPAFARPCRTPVRERTPPTPAYQASGSTAITTRSQTRRPEDENHKQILVGDHTLLNGIAIVQTCIVHLLRNSFKYASKKDWGVIAKDLKPIYNAASEADALDRFAEFSGKWEKRYPAIIRLWENAWAEFVPFLRFDREIRDRYLHHQRDRIY